ncbi:hypothetical protein Tco_1541742, partial [Tanacetum coccineum]
MPRECLKIIESKSKVRQSRSKAIVSKVSTSSSTPAVSSDVAELKDMVRALNYLYKKNQTPAPVKAVEQSSAATNFNQEIPVTVPSEVAKSKFEPLELKVVEAKTVKSSIDEPPKVELKDLPPHLEYAFLEGDDKLPVIIAKDLKDEEKAALIKVLKSHKRAIAWKLSDIKGVDPEFCTHKILMEEDYEPTVQSQRRVNPKIHDVIKKEVEKLLDAGLIYPISDSPWVSP